MANKKYKQKLSGNILKKSINYVACIGILLTTVAPVTSFGLTVTPEISEGIQSNEIATGIFGDSSWRIDTEGTLHIGAGTFAYGGTSPWKTWASEIKQVVFEGKVIAGANSNALFQNFTNVTSFENMHYFDMSNVVGARAIWENCSSLISLDLSSSNAGQATRGLSNSSMFSGCSNLKSLDLRSVKFETYHEKAFLNDTKLSQITLDGSLKLMDKGSYPKIPDTAQYTGKWTNVGSGTVDSPAGNSIVDSDDMFGFGSVMPDTYVWQKKEIGGDVTVKYVDTEGKKISEDVVKTGNVGDTYTTEEKAISGYTFKEAQGSTTGAFTDKAQTVTYVYTKDAVKAADVTAKYVDTEGKKISEDVVKTGNVGDTYTTEEKAISGYTFKEAQGSTTGTFTDKAQTVSYIYKVDQSTLNVKDSTIYTGDKWKPQDNFVSAFDKDGEKVDFKQVTVDDSKINPSKSGTYEVTYTYAGVTSTAKVTVKDKQTTVNVHDSSIYVGDTWKAEDNFDSALDKDGNKINFIQLTIDDSKVDTTKAGVYEVIYTYDGVTSIAKVTVYLVENNKDSKVDKIPMTKISKSKSELPKTGTNDSPIWLNIIGGITTIASLAFFFRRKN